MPFDALEDKYVSGLETDIQERTLISPINSSNPDHQGVGPHQNFFDDLFQTLAMPLVTFMDDLTEKHKLKSTEGCSTSSTKVSIFWYRIVKSEPKLRTISLGNLIRKRKPLYAYLLW